MMSHIFAGDRDDSCHTHRYHLPATVRGNHIFAVKISDNVESDEPEHNVVRS